MSMVILLKLVHPLKL